MSLLDVREASPSVEAVASWSPVCRYDDLLPERGAAALLGDQQVALFRSATGELHAISNIDPFTGAAVLSRGIVGSRGETPTVASPLHEQLYDLRTGWCLDGDGDGGVKVPTYDIPLRRGIVEVRVLEVRTVE
jgi:nitrite reductase (NADH) small subunit